MITLRNTTDLQKLFIAKNCARGFVPKLSKVEVEFTENGEFSVTPSAGYVGMAKVDVTVDVTAPLYFDENGGVFYTNTSSFTEVPEWITIEGNKVTVQPSNRSRTATLGNIVITQEGAYEKPLTLEAITNGTITWETWGDTPRTIKYSKNGDELTEITSSRPGIEIQVNEGDILQFWGDNEVYGISGNHYNFFSGTAAFNASGNVMSLISSEGFAELDELGDYALKRLFEASRIRSAEGLVLPATNLGYDCYYGMFQMSSLNKAPKVIPAVGESSCRCMFNSTYITTAPELPATTLAIYCYNQMFQECSKLEVAPDLPATVLPDGCYASMFLNCSKLSSIKCLATDTSANNCTNYWLYGVASTGTFTKDANTTWPTGISGIPENWTVVDA